MKDENRKEKIERLMGLREELSELTTSISNGDEAFKKIMEGAKSVQEESIPSSPQENLIVEAIKKMSEQWSALWNNKFSEEILGELAKNNDEVISELRSDRSRIIQDTVPREGNVGDDTTLLLHEILHEAIDAETKRPAESQKTTFSNDFDKYNEQLKDFLNYVALTKEIEPFAIIKVNREDNVIKYGMIKQGLLTDVHEIIMTESDNLKELYESLKDVFGADFVYGVKHEMMRGWSLLPTIGETIMLEIDSNSQDDRVWIYEEVHNRPPRIVDEPRKK